VYLTDRKRVDVDVVLLLLLLLLLLLVELFVVCGANGGRPSLRLLVDTPLPLPLPLPFPLPTDWIFRSESEPVNERDDDDDYNNIHIWTYRAHMRARYESYTTVLALATVTREVPPLILLIVAMSRSVANVSLLDSMDASLVIWARNNTGAGGHDKCCFNNRVNIDSRKSVMAARLASLITIKIATMSHAQHSTAACQRMMEVNMPDEIYWCNGCDGALLDELVLEKFVSAAIDNRLTTASNSFKLAFTAVATLNFNDTPASLLCGRCCSNGDSGDIGDVGVDVGVGSMSGGNGEGMPTVPLGNGNGWRPCKSKNRNFHWVPYNM
jgi:hypothetical protein